MLWERTNERTNESLVCLSLCVTDRFCFCFCLEKTYRLSHAQTNSVVVIIRTSFDKIMGKESGYASIIANRAACVHVCMDGCTELTRSNRTATLV